MYTAAEKGKAKEISPHFFPSFNPSVTPYSPSFPSSSNSCTPASQVTPYTSPHTSSHPLPHCTSSSPLCTNSSLTHRDGLAGTPPLDGLASPDQSVILATLETELFGLPEAFAPNGSTLSFQLTAPYCDEKGAIRCHTPIKVWSGESPLGRFSNRVSNKLGPLLSSGVISLRGFLLRDYDWSRKGQGYLVVIDVKGIPTPQLEKSLSQFTCKREWQVDALSLSIGFSPLHQLDCSPTSPAAATLSHNSSSSSSPSSSSTSSSSSSSSSSNPSSSSGSSSASSSTTTGKDQMTADLHLREELFNQGAKRRERELKIKQEEKENRSAQHQAHLERMAIKRREKGSNSGNTSTSGAGSLSSPFSGNLTGASNSQSLDSGSSPIWEDGDVEKEGGRSEGKKKKKKNKKKNKKKKKKIGAIGKEKKRKRTREKKKIERQVEKRKREEEQRKLDQEERRLEEERKRKVSSEEDLKAWIANMSRLAVEILKTNLPQIEENPEYETFWKPYSSLILFSKLIQVQLIQDLQEAEKEKEKKEKQRLRFNRSQASSIRLPMSKEILDSFSQASEIISSLVKHQPGSEEQRAMKVDFERVEKVILPKIKELVRKSRSEAVRDPRLSKSSSGKNEFQVFCFLYQSIRIFEEILASIKRAMVSTLFSAHFSSQAAPNAQPSTPTTSASSSSSSAAPSDTTMETKSMNRNERRKQEGLLRKVLRKVFQKKIAGEMAEVANRKKSESSNVLKFKKESISSTNASSVRSSSKVKSSSQWGEDFWRAIGLGAGNRGIGNWASSFHSFKNLATSNERQRVLALRRRLAIEERFKRERTIRETSRREKFDSRPSPVISFENDCVPNAISQAFQSINDSIPEPKNHSQVPLPTSNGDVRALMNRILQGMPSSIVDSLNSSLPISKIKSDVDALITPGSAIPLYIIHLFGVALGFEIILQIDSKPCRIGTFSDVAFGSITLSMTSGPVAHVEFVSSVLQEDSEVLEEQRASSDLERETSPSSLNLAELSKQCSDFDVSLLIPIGSEAVASGSTAPTSAPPKKKTRVSTAEPAKASKQDLFDLSTSTPKSDGFYGTARPLSGTLEAMLLNMKEPVHFITTPGGIEKIPQEEVDEKLKKNKGVETFEGKGSNPLDRLVEFLSDRCHFPEARTKEENKAVVKKLLNENGIKLDNNVEQLLRMLRPGTSFDGVEAAVAAVDGLRGSGLLRDLQEAGQRHNGVTYDRLLIVRVKELKEWLKLYIEIILASNDGSDTKCSAQARLILQDINQLPDNNYYLLQYIGCTAFWVDKRVNEDLVSAVSKVKDGLQGSLSLIQFMEYQFFQVQSPESDSCPKLTIPKVSLKESRSERKKKLKPKARKSRTPSTPSLELKEELHSSKIAGFWRQSLFQPKTGENHYDAPEAIYFLELFSYLLVPREQLLNGCVPVPKANPLKFPILSELSEAYESMMKKSNPFASISIYSNASWQESIHQLCTRLMPGVELSMNTTLERTQDQEENPNDPEQENLDDQDTDYTTLGNDQESEDESVADTEEQAPNTSEKIKDLVNSEENQMKRFKDQIDESFEKLEKEENSQEGQGGKKDQEKRKKKKTIMLDLCFLDKSSINVCWNSIYHQLLECQMLDLKTGHSHALSSVLERKPSLEARSSFGIFLVKWPSSNDTAQRIVRFSQIPGHGDFASLEYRFHQYDGSSNAGTSAKRRSLETLQLEQLQMSRNNLDRLRQQLLFYRVVLASHGALDNTELKEKRNFAFSLLQPTLERYQELNFLKDQRRFKTLVFKVKDRQLDQEDLEKVVSSIQVIAPKGELPYDLGLIVKPGEKSKINFKANIQSQFQQSNKSSDGDTEMSDPDTQMSDSEPTASVAKDSAEEEKDAEEETWKIKWFYWWKRGDVDKNPHLDLYYSFKPELEENQRFILSRFNLLRLAPIPSFSSALFSSALSSNGIFEWDEIETRREKVTLLPEWGGGTPWKANVKDQYQLAGRFNSNGLLSFGDATMSRSDANSEVQTKPVRMSKSTWSQVGPLHSGQQWQLPEEDKVGIFFAFLESDAVKLVYCQPLKTQNRKSKTSIAGTDIYTSTEVSTLLCNPDNGTETIPFLQLAILAARGSQPHKRLWSLVKKRIDKKRLDFSKIKIQKRLIGSSAITERNMELTYTSLGIQQVAQVLNSCSDASTLWNEDSVKKLDMIVKIDVLQSLKQRSL